MKLGFQARRVLPQKNRSPQVPLPRSGSYIEDQESFLGFCVLQKLNPFTFFFIQLSWLFPLLWSCVRGPTILFSPQPPHAKLWKECLSIGLLTRILLSFRSKTCLIFLSILLVQSLWSPLDHVRFILSHDRSQLEDRSSEREFSHLFPAYYWDGLSKLQLYAVCSEVDAQMKEIQPSLRGSLGSNEGHEKVKLAINKVKRVSTRSQASREREEPVINHW